MNREAIRTWGRETLVAEGLIWKAFFHWLGLMIVGIAMMPILPFILMAGGAPKIVQAVYSFFIIIPVLILFHLNAVFYFVLALFGVVLNYDGAFYGAVKWIERKKLYEATDTKK